MLNLQVWFLRYQYSENQKFTNKDISLKVPKDMDIGRVVAPVILAMVIFNFVRTVPCEVMFSIIWPMLFYIKVKDTTVLSLLPFCIFLRRLCFGSDTL